MAQGKIILNDEQVKLIAQSRGPIQVCDPSGNVIGSITRNADWLEQQDILECKRRLADNQPRHTTDQVMERLRKLSGK